MVSARTRSLRRRGDSASGLGDDGQLGEKIGTSNWVEKASCTLSKEVQVEEDRYGDFGDLRGVRKPVIELTVELHELELGIEVAMGLRLNFSRSCLQAGSCWGDRPA